MKTIFTYDYLDNNEKAHYQSIEISDEDEEQWISADLERRIAEAAPEEKDKVQARTLNDLMSELNKESFNSDRKQLRHKDKNQYVEDEDGNEISKIDMLASDDLTQSDKLIEEEKRQQLNKKIEEALSLVTPTQRRRIIKRYKDDMTLAEIAAEEGTSIASVDESIKSGMKKIQKKYK